VKKTLLTFFLSSLLLCHFSAFGLSTLEDLEGGESIDQQLDLPDLPTEQIIKAGFSRKIFILTNKNSNLSKGDFITIVSNKRMATRALVAKTTADQLCGIKILKIYSLDTWNNLRIGSNVQIIKGDDSFAKNKLTSGENGDDSTGGKIQEEEDLFNDTAVLNDDLTLEENSKRLLKTDNIISAHLSSYEGIDDSNSSKRYLLTGASWSYQVEDNIWGEISFIQGTAKDFPNSGLSTTLRIFTFKGKYTFSGPSYSYFLPYIGYQIVSAESPDAGVDGDGTIEQSVLDQEIELVDNFNKNKIIFGVTALKRLVPGWFVRADLGTDALSAGVSLEF